VSHPVSSKVPPKELTGEKHGILVESLEGSEGTANLELQVLLTVKQQVSISLLKSHLVKGKSEL
jgi:hypothetical protein